MKKKIHTDGTGQATGNSEITVKKKTPAKYVQPQWITDYMRERDRSLFHKVDKESQLAMIERWTSKTK